MRLVDTAWAKEDWSQVIALLTQARLLDPSNQSIIHKLYDAYYNYGDAFMRQNRPVEAAQQFQNARTIEPNRPEAPIRMLELTPTPAATPCTIVVMSGFEAIYARNRNRLGCAIEPGRVPSNVAEQPFQNGHMFWTGDFNETFVTYDNAGDWQLFQGDQNRTGSPRGYTPPGPGLQEPIRGFSWIWQNYLGGPNARIGWATDKEQGFSFDRIQTYVNGRIFQDSDGRTRVLAYVLFNDGRMVRESLH